jgi:cellulose synthase/poly-beta-1,6-N-acetylglucosamine synthase-like glycosyltransferase
MSSIDALLLTAYFAVLIVLAIFGCHRYLMVYLYYKHRKKKPLAIADLETLPVVTVQLPIFNEMYVVERLIDAAVRLEYPKDLLEIQVLDDSTDETTEIARRRVEFYRARGWDIHYLHREVRHGFKAGALAAGLSQARGELLAIFDADFLPPSDFLRSVLIHFRRAEVGMVQARWGHINRDYSLLTRVQSILLDAHFVLEHGARYLSGRFFNFNGTAGVWRRAAIEDAGGWQHDTLTEDMDLSYRAQLKGWRFVFLPDVVCPAELPVEMNAFKSQQHRWSKGSIQTAKKLLPRLLASRLPLAVKAEAVFHLTANLAYPLMVALSLLMFPSMLIRYNMGWQEMLLVDVPLFVAATCSVTTFYVVSQKEIYPDWKERIRYLPLLMSLGIGMSVNNGRGVVEGLGGRETGFVRTPKYRIESNRDNWRAKKYRGARGYLPAVEIALGLYFSATVAYAVTHLIFGTLPFLLLFQVGYLTTGLMSWLQPFRDSGFEAAPRLLTPAARHR